MWGYAMAVDLAVNTRDRGVLLPGVARAMWFEPAPDGDESPVAVPPSVRTALAITVVATILFGVLPGLVSDAAQLGPVAAIAP